MKKPIKGGIGIHKNYTSDEAFDFFQKNSKMRLLTDSSRYGVIFELILNPGVESPYYSIRSNDIRRQTNTSIRNLIYKICLIKDKNDYKKNDDSSEYYNNPNYPIVDNSQPEYLKSVVTSQDFFKEVKMQMDIYNKSNEDFESICPSIVYSQIYDIDSTVVNKPENEYDDEDASKKIKTIYSYNNIFADVQQNKIPKYGIIVMEYACNGQTVGDLVFKSDDEKKDVYKLVLFEHYRLFNLNYFHGDFHLYNALYCENYPYTKTIENRVILIDYGTTFRVPKGVRKTFIESVKTNNNHLYAFTEILLDHASSVYGSDFENREHAPYFKWITKARQLLQGEPDCLKDLEAARKEYIKETKILSTDEYITFKKPTKVGDLQKKKTAVKEKKNTTVIGGNPSMSDFVKHEKQNQKNVLKNLIKNVVFNKTLSKRGRSSSHSQTRNIKQKLSNRMTSTE